MELPELPELGELSEVNYGTAPLTTQEKTNDENPFPNAIKDTIEAYRKVDTPGVPVVIAVATVSYRGKQVNGGEILPIISFKFGSLNVKQLLILPRRNKKW